MMDVSLTLEVEEGCKVDNLMNEINKKFKRYSDRAELYEFSNRNYLALINYKKALKIDPDNYLKNKIEYKIKKLTENIITELFYCANNNFKRRNYNLSLFYYITTLAYLIEIEKKDDYIEYYCNLRIKQLRNLKNIETLKYDTIYYMRKI